MQAYTAVLDLIGGFQGASQQAVNAHWQAEMLAWQAVILAWQAVKLFSK